MNPAKCWRYVSGEYDGAVHYECIGCKNDWLAGEPPGYIDTQEDGSQSYVPIWNFCPHCGVRWEGTVDELGRTVGPRRKRIQDAIERRRASLPFIIGRSSEPARKPDAWFAATEQIMESGKPFLNKLQRDGCSAKEFLADIRERYPVGSVVLVGRVGANYGTKIVINDSPTS